MIDAIAVANAAVNGAEIETRRADALAQELPPAELVAANISLASVDALGGRLDARRAITSGYLAADQPTLPGFRRLERRTLDGWAADLFQRDASTDRWSGRGTVAPA